MGWLVYMLSRFIARGIFSLLGNVRVFHAERSALAGPCVLASNHISHFDPPLISVAARRKIDWMAVKELFKHPLASLYLRTIHTFPVDRQNLDRASVKTAWQRLKAGRMVGMFPEGGIRAGATSVLEGAPIKPGAGALALMAGAPVLPCVVIGTDRLYNRKNWRLFGRTPFRVGFGEPILLPAGMDKAGARAHLDRELSAALRRLLAEMRGHYGLTEADLPKTPGQRRAEA
jgi:1-acyl-sn-glycerol-3-phosphate acyltransferase